MNRIFRALRIVTVPQLAGGCLLAACLLPARLLCPL